MKRLERDRDAGAVTSTGRGTLAAYLAEWALRRERLRLSARIPCSATSAQTPEFVRVRTSSYEFVRVRARSQLQTLLHTLSTD